ncbi:MAG: hypothetical protein AAFR60_01010 [Pseudomonadota bacterium]
MAKLIIQEGLSDKATDFKRLSCCAADGTAQHCCGGSSVWFNNRLATETPRPQRNARAEPAWLYRGTARALC